MTATALPLCAYGKLPFHEEYLRVRCGAGAAGAYYQWINRGFDHAVRLGTETPFRLGRCWRLLFYPEGLKEVVVATIRDSVDSSGSREFPFTCFSVLRRTKLTGDPRAQVKILSSAWTALSAADRSLSTTTTFEEFKDGFRRVALPFPVEVEEPVAEVPMKSLARALFPDQPGVGFGGLLYELYTAYATIASKRISGEPPALRIPLAEGIDVHAQVVAWLGCLEACGFLAGRRAPVSIAYPEHASAGGSLWVVIRPPKPADLLMLGCDAPGLLHPEPGWRLSPEDLDPRVDFMARVNWNVLHEGCTLDDLGRFPMEVPE